MYASVGKVAILKQNIATSQAFYNLVFDKKETRNFCFQYLKMMEDNNLWSRLISTGTQSNLNADKVKTLSISLPKSLEEQELIGNYLNKLDSLITLHQREYEKMKDVKKILLNIIYIGGSICQTIKL